MPYQHTPVLASEVLSFLALPFTGIFVDCTLGGGGHTGNLKSQIPCLAGSPRVEAGRQANLKVYGFDQDSEAIQAAKERLSQYQDIYYIQDNFSNLKNHLHAPIDGILFDLGVSSHQIDAPSRGFSLREDGPLDMRMDKSNPLIAADIVNNYDEEALAKIIYRYGEERFSRRIARAIVHHRQKKSLQTTTQLREIIEKSIPTWKKRESVTRVFQALRIAVNNELENLEKALVDAVDLLKPGGKIVVIAYHSLEDRIVKNIFKKGKAAGQLKLLTKKPVQASPEEIASNPRSKSAKLRAAEKLPLQTPSLPDHA